MNTTNVSKFDRRAVYLATGLSTAFSVMLWSSIGISWTTSILFAAAALVIEISKFKAFPQLVRAIQNRSESGTLFSGIIFAVTFTLSVGASIGTMSAQTAQLIEEGAQSSTRRAQLALSIQQNNAQIERYIALDRLKADAQPLQAENRRLQAELNTLPVVQSTAITSLFKSIATITGLTLQQAASYTFCLIAIAIDVCALYLLTLAALASPLMPLSTPALTPDPEKQPLPRAHETCAEDCAAHNSTQMLDYDTIVQAVIEHKIKPTVRGIVEAGVSWPVAKNFRQQMIDEGLLEKHSNGRCSLSKQAPLKLVS